MLEKMEWGLVVMMENMRDTWLENEWLQVLDEWDEGVCVVVLRGGI